ncbi:MAG: serine hydrolase [Anaerolineaceae bacterium]|nr:serine hydrolase [Anaerolineaceae bacterium]
MRRRGSLSILRWVSVFLIFLAVLITGVTLVQYSRIRSTFPPGMVIGGVPVAGLSQQQAAERLSQAYGAPVELHYGDAIIQLRPSVVGFKLDLEAMLAAADLQRITQPFWSAFWDYLWNRLSAPSAVPLRATISEERLRLYLTEEIAARYNRPAQVSLPVPGSVDFQAGEAGSVLDINRAGALIEDALKSPQSRVVNLTFNQVAPGRPSLQNLQILLQQTIDLAGFDGLAEFYLLDLQNRQELSFAYQQGKNLPPNIAFTAASTMKIPIMVSVFNRVPEPAPEGIRTMLELMIERSENDPADRMMEMVMDRNLGPLQVTDDLNALGLKSTFLAGYFYPGAPLLRRFETPGNSRKDTNTEPDAYNQTTPPEMAMLLDDIYQCSETGGGTFAAVFPGKISRSECQLMIEYLARNKIGVLLQAGLPEGTRFAHKHGWLLDYDGLIHHMSDVGIAYTPGGNYIIAIYLYHPVQIVFDPINQLMANFSRAIYNYFNLNASP